MTPAHPALAAGRWQELPFLEKMANIGSEVHRALQWKTKKKEVYSLKAADRALELLDLSLDANLSFPQRRELTRVRELLVDYFYGDNEFGSTESSWRKYFFYFNLACRKDH